METRLELFTTKDKITKYFIEHLRDFSLKGFEIGDCSSKGKNTTYFRFIRLIPEEEIDIYWISDIQKYIKKIDSCISAKLRDGYIDIEIDEYTFENIEEFETIII